MQLSHCVWEFRYKGCSNETRLGIVLGDAVEANKNRPRVYSDIHLIDESAVRTRPQRFVCVLLQSGQMHKLDSFVHPLYINRCQYVIIIIYVLLAFCEYARKNVDSHPRFQQTNIANPCSGLMCLETLYSAGHRQWVVGEACNCSICWNVGELSTWGLTYSEKLSHELQVQRKKEKM
jgi:hypothetical protein